MTEKGRMLSDMSLEELWQLFPIILTDHNEKWKGWYEEEYSGLVNILPSGMIKQISHVGSTAIRKIKAKPIVDILMELRKDSDPADRSCMEITGDILCANGWICMSRGNRRMSFNKGYTEDGFAERVFHLHLRYEGDNDEIYFRDYMNAHPDAAREYEKLKLSLWKKYEHDRDGYTGAKTEFVEKYTKIAKVSQAV